MRLLFVCGKGFVSGAIEWRESICMPFTPSHVECVTPAGLYLGQHIEGGMQARSPDYDAGTFAHELFIDLPATADQDKAFYDYMIGSVGEPYDWQAIIGYGVPGHHHEKFSAICSAKVTLGLRTKGCEWFPSRVPLAVPAHCIDPRDLLLMISAIVPTPR